MKCSKCGNEVTENSLFCGKCGNRIKYNCVECGTGIVAGAKFCARCSAEILNTGRNTSIISGDDSENFSDDLFDEEKTKSIKITIFLVIIVFLTATIAGYVYYSPNNIHSNDIEEKIGQSTNVTSQEIKEVVLTKKEDISVSSLQGEDMVAVKENYIDNNGYGLYESDLYNISCKYPSWFKCIEETDTDFICTAPDDSGNMYVSYLDGQGKSVEDILNNYILALSEGVVDYKSYGDDYFAVRIKYGSKYHYKYSKFRGDKIYSFSFIFKENEFQTYDDMINYIYKDFIKQF